MCRERAALFRETVCLGVVRRQPKKKKKEKRCCYSRGIVYSILSPSSAFDKGNSYHTVLFFIIDNSSAENRSSLLKERQKQTEPRRFVLLV